MFSQEKVTAPKKLATRSTTKRIHAMTSAQAPKDNPNALKEENFPSDKDNLIIDLQE
jgi:hypothetical protein